MIYLPLTMRKVKYPGYFWCTAQHHLYTIKGGILRKLKKYPPSNFSSNPKSPYYIVSHDNVQKYLLHDYLIKLKPHTKPIQMDMI